MEDVQSSVVDDGEGLAHSSPCARRGCVLVVDDDDGVREVYCRILDRLGYAVIPAVNGLDALERFAANPDGVDLVILDLAMPVMDGYECCQALQSINSHVRVLVATGHPPAEPQTGWQGQAVRGVLFKPFTAAALKEAIDRALIV